MLLSLGESVMANNLSVLADVGLSTNLVSV